MQAGNNEQLDSDCKALSVRPEFLFKSATPDAEEGKNWKQQYEADAQVIF